MTAAPELWPHRRAERRFPRWLYDDGDEPDPRFSLANERTFLAWIRTSLALLAGAVGLHALAPGGQPAVRSLLVVALLTCGALGAVVALLRWLLTERAMRLQRPLPSLAVPALCLLAGVTAIAGALLLVTRG